MQNIFREYDIRGIFKKELNRESVYWIGFYIGKEVKRYGDYISVGYDARVHSVTLFQYLSAGLSSAGLTILDNGLVPTPNNYFTNYINFNGISPSGSIMITGSHNPPEYNGFKITVNRRPFFGKDIYAIGKMVSEAVRKDIKIDEDQEIKVLEIPAKERYIDYLVKEFNHLSSLKSKIIYDVGNGTAGVIVKEVFEKLGIDAKGLYIRPDGTFPNHHPDPSEEENLQDIKKELKSKKFQVGFAYDGDADRIAVLTNKHSIKGDILALLFAKMMDKPTVIGEVKCSQIMYDLIDKMGGKAVMYKTGHSNLKVKIKELNADLAAEVSGHIFFNDRYFGFDDAIYTTLRVLELIYNGMDLDKEVEALPKVISTEEIKIKTTEDRKFQIIDEVKERLKDVDSSFPKIRKVIDVDGVRVIFKNGWGLVRASNTTPVLVTRFEADNEENLKLYQDSLNSLIELSLQ
jgi:phosphomannomutase/phosphoglucomutase